MFGIGGPELVFIFVLALLIFGPKRLPQIGRTIGKGMAEFRRASTELQRAVNTELEEPPAWRSQPAAAAAATAVAPAAAAAAVAAPVAAPPSAAATSTVASAATEGAAGPNDEAFAAMLEELAEPPAAEAAPVEPHPTTPTRLQ